MIYQIAFSEVETDNEEFIAETDADSAFEDLNIIAYYQENFPYDQIDLVGLMLQHDFHERIAPHMIVAFIDMEWKFESNRYKSQSIDEQNPANTGAHHMKIFGFEESVSFRNENSIRLTSPDICSCTIITTANGYIPQMGSTSFVKKGILIIYICSVSLLRMNTPFSVESVYIESIVRPVGRFSDWSNITVVAHDTDASSNAAEGLPAKPFAKHW